MFSVIIADFYVFLIILHFLQIQAFLVKKCLTLHGLIHKLWQAWK